MKNIKTSLLTLAFLTASSLTALSMEEIKDDSNSKITPTCSFKYEDKEIITLGNDHVIQFNKNNPTYLMKKNYKYFKDNHDVFIELNGKIIVHAPPSESYKYLLESNRFSIKEGQEIKLSYDIDVRSGPICIGFLDTTRAKWLEWRNLEMGEHKYGYLGIKIPKEESITSLVLFHNGKRNNNADFLIKNIKFTIEESTNK